MNPTERDERIADPWIDEIRSIRRKIWERCHHNMAELGEFLRKVEAEQETRRTGKEGEGSIPDEAFTEAAATLFRERDSRETGDAQSEPG